jgi:hypothetical protein
MIQFANKAAPTEISNTFNTVPWVRDEVCAGGRKSVIWDSSSRIACYNYSFHWKRLTSMKTALTITIAVKKSVVQHPLAVASNWVIIQDGLMFFPWACR